MIKNIYMAGCGGMLGEAFYKVFKNKYLIAKEILDYVLP